MCQKLGEVKKMERKAWKIVRKTGQNYYFLPNDSYGYPLLILTALEKRQISILAQKGSIETISLLDQNIYSNSPKFTQKQYFPVSSPHPSVLGVSVFFGWWRYSDLMRLTGVFQNLDLFFFQGYKNKNHGLHACFKPSQMSLFKCHFQLYKTQNISLSRHFPIKIQVNLERFW